MTSRLAHDTQALRWKQLTKEEVDIIEAVNNLIKDVHQAASNGTRRRKGSRFPRRDDNDPWATPEMDRFVNIILLDGKRGSGKTSLLLTLIAGWQDYTRLLEETATSTIAQQDRDDASEAFAGMGNLVRCLRPLDFDPLPPDLPLYSWIIQAFDPLVAKIGGEASNVAWDDDPHLSLRDRFRKLQNAAMLGWTSGLLKDSVARDMGDFLVWLSEQQSKWQDLERDWQGFLDELFAQDRGVHIPPDAVIVLPIDDLDLQSSRTRELLLAMRLLRHERLVYILTGDVLNLNIGLQADFFRSYTQRDALTDALRDHIREESEDLASGLIAKVIPDTQQFLLKGLELSELLDWTPTGATPIEEILYKFDQGPEFTLRLRRILEANSRRGRYVQYRALQAFHDRWASQPDRKCFGEFLKILIGRFAEEPMDVEFETEGVIELSQNPSVVAPAPRHYGTVEVPELNASIQWMRELDFARLRISGNVSETEWHGKRGLPREIVIADAAPPEHVLTVDLASEFAHSIRVFSGPRFADETISLVWSVVKADSEDEDLLLSPWPMLDEPKSPTTWKERFDEWSEHIKAVLTPDGKVTADTLLEAWFRFNVQDPGSESTGPPAGRTLATRLKNTIQRASSERRDRARNVLAPLAAAVFALPKWCRNAVKGATMTSRDARRVEETAGRRVLSWNRSKHDPYELAMWPSYPYSRANVESVEALIRRYPISKLFR